MCLIAFALGVSARWPLVVAANRDEYWARPTVPLARWQTGSGCTVMSGRDLQAGGAWMGMSPTGRVAFLTNVREPGPPKLSWRSRGELVIEWLTGEQTAASDAPALLHKLQTQAQSGAAFGGFNLVVGDTRTGLWHWLSNRLNGQCVPPAAWPSRQLSPGVYGLSNAALNTPWPKTIQATSQLKTAVDSSRSADELAEALWAAMACRTQFCTAAAASSRHVARSGIGLVQCAGEFSRTPLRYPQQHAADDHGARQRRLANDDARAPTAVG